MLARHLAGAIEGPGRVRARARVLAARVVIVGACALGALPAVAAADPPTSCPDLSGVGAYGGTDDAASELRALRLEANTGCQLAHADAVKLDQDLVQLHVDVAAAPLPVDTGNRDVNVTNQPDLAPIETAATTGVDTTHSDLWALAGFCTGGVFLFVLHRILRGEA